MSFGDLLQNDNRKKMTRRPHARHFNSSPAPTSRAHGQASEAGHAPQAATMSETAHTTQAADQYALHESEAGVLHDQFVHSHQMNFNDTATTEIYTGGESSAASDVYKRQPDALRPSYRATFLLHQQDCDA